MPPSEPSTCTIARLAPARDLDAVAAIEAMAFPSPWSQAMLGAALAPSQRPHAYVTRSDQAVTAYCIGQLVVDELHIHTFAVHPTWQRAGLGRRLLEAVLRQAESVGISASTLEVRRSNIAAQRLYESGGFTQRGVRRGYYRVPPDDALIYWRRQADAASTPRSPSSRGPSVP